MSISALSLTIGLAGGYNPGSDFIWAKQVAGWDGSDLAVPDTFGKLPILISSSVPEDWSEETGETQSGVTYPKRNKKSAVATLMFASSEVDVLKSIQDAMEGNIYVFIREEHKKPVNDKWRATIFLGQLVAVPNWDQSAEAEFQFRMLEAEADITIGLDTDITGASIPIPASTDITLSQGNFRDALAIAWP